VIGFVRGHPCRSKSQRGAVILADELSAFWAWHVVLLLAREVMTRPSRRIRRGIPA
jgi:hypothetical protein